MYLLEPTLDPQAETPLVIPPDGNSVDGYLKCNALDADNDVDTCVCIITRYDLIVAMRLVISMDNLEINIFTHNAYFFF